MEGELQRALEELYGSVDGLAVAGRTDRGVHAIANVVSAEVDGGPPVERAAEALNAALPDDLSVVRAERAADAFHARFDAFSRSYRYRLWRRREHCDADRFTRSDRSLLVSRASPCRNASILRSNWSRRALSMYLPLHMRIPRIN